MYNPRRQDVRLAQIQVLLAELDRIAGAPNNGRYLPVVLTGDFNLHPNTAPYRLIRNGTLKYEELAARTLENLERGDSEKNGKTLLPSSLGITDDCQHVEKNNKKGSTPVNSKNTLENSHL